MIKKTLYIACLGLFLQSCSFSSHLLSGKNETLFPPTTAEAIQVFSTDNIEKNYIVVGEVLSSADAGSNSALPVKLLKKEAAKMGADAIINLRLEIEYGGWSSAIKATGTAIKYN